MKDITLPARLAMADENPDSREAKLRSARRRLDFGDTDDKTKEDIDKKLAQERAEHLEEKKTKWNFDFNEEQPLEGQWQWERVDKSSQEPSNGKSSAQNAPENTDANARRTRGDAQRQAP